MLLYLKCERNESIEQEETKKRISRGLSAARHQLLDVAGGNLLAQVRPGEVDENEIGDDEDDVHSKGGMEDTSLKGG